jgi:hypothetical protein
MAYTGNDPYEEAKLRSRQQQEFYYSDDFYDDIDDYPKDFDDFDDLGNDEPEEVEGAPPAEITDIPTSTTNVSKPRTLAAGYDESRQTMTVVFRDGTVYNYYDVSAGEWQNFQASISKGNPWLNKANRNQGADGLFIGKPQGLADLTYLDPALKAAIVAEAREAQVKFQTKRMYRQPNQKRGTPAATKKLGKTGTLKAQRSLRARTPKRGGANPSNGGKNPSK